MNNESPVWRKMAWETIYKRYCRWAGYRRIRPRMSSSLKAFMLQQGAIRPTTGGDMVLLKCAPISVYNDRRKPKPFDVCRTPI